MLILALWQVQDIWRENGPDGDEDGLTDDDFYLYFQEQRARGSNKTWGQAWVDFCALQQVCSAKQILLDVGSLYMRVKLIVIAYSFLQGELQLAEFCNVWQIDAAAAAKLSTVIIRKHLQATNAALNGE